MPKTNIHPPTATATVEALPPKVEYESWRAWLPPNAPEPEPLLTRAELLDRLREDGVNVNETTLVYWEKSGVLPRAIRRWHHGKQAALYPEWMVPVAANVRLLLDSGWGLRQTALVIRIAYDQAIHPDKGDALIQAAVETSHLVLYQPVAAFARIIARQHGRPLAGVQIVVKFADGDPDYTHAWLFE